MSNENTPPVDFEVTTKTVSPDEYEAAKQYGEKSIVSINLMQCPVTMHLWEVNSLTVQTKRFKRPGMQGDLPKYIIQGRQPLPEVQEMFDQDYVALVVADPKKSTVYTSSAENELGRAKLDQVYRTGEIVWVKAHAAKDIFGLDVKNYPGRIAFIAPDGLEQIKQIQQRSKEHHAKES